MAMYPIKMLKDEEGNAFVPLTSSEALKTPDGKTLDEKLQNKLETTNIKAGTDINITVDGNNVTINNASKGVLIDNLTTETSGVGSLDAHQGKILKDMIPEVVNDITSTDGDKALSAYQGYLLSGKVVPTGGKEGQVLKKSSDTNWSLEWGDAADPNAIVGDGSIKKIVELTYEEYKELEEAGEIDEETEYHVADSLSVIDNLQDKLDDLQRQIVSLRNTLNERASKFSSGYAVVAGDGVMEGGKIIDFHSDFTTGNDFDTRLECTGHNQNAVILPSESGTLALTSQLPLGVSEHGSIPTTSFTNFTFGTNTNFMYYTVTFTKKYTNVPTVIVRCNDRTSKGYYGSLDSFYVKELTNTKCVIVTGWNQYKADNIRADYIVISND